MWRNCRSSMPQFTLCAPVATTTVSTFEWLKETSSPRRSTSRGTTGEVHLGHRQVQSRSQDTPVPWLDAYSPAWQTSVILYNWWDFLLKCVYRNKLTLFTDLTLHMPILPPDAYCNLYRWPLYTILVHITDYHGHRWISRTRVKQILYRKPMLLQNPNRSRTQMVLNR